MINHLELKVKKDCLQFKKAKLNGHEKLESFLRETFPLSEFVWLDSEHITSSLLKIRDNQVAGLSSRNRLAMEELDLKREDIKKLVVRLKDRELTELSPWVLVVPQIWEKSGGFLMHSRTLFRAFEKLSSFFDDDFDLYSENLSDQICFRGNRTGDKLTSMEVRIKGDHFKFVGNL